MPFQVKSQYQHKFVKFYAGINFTHILISHVRFYAGIKIKVKFPVFLAKFYASIKKCLCQNWMKVCASIKRQNFMPA